MENNSSSIKKKVNAITRLLELIEGVNEDIKLSKLTDSSILQKQYQHLKKDYTKQLLDLLAEYHLPVMIQEKE